MATHRKVVDGTLFIYDGQTELLSMRETVRDDCVMIELKGDLSGATMFDFQDELFALNGVGMNLLLDFKEVGYISSSCQQVLLQVQQMVDKDHRGSLVLTKLPPKIREEFENIGLDQLLYIEE